MGYMLSKSLSLASFLTQLVIKMKSQAKSYYLPVQKGDVTVDPEPDRFRTLKEFIFGFKLRYKFSNKPFLIFLGRASKRTEGHTVLAPLLTHPTLLATFTYIKHSHSEKRRVFHPVPGNSRLPLKMRPIAPAKFLADNASLIRTYDSQSQKYVKSISNPFFPNTGDDRDLLL